MKATKSRSTLAAMQRVQLYYESHPGSPSAVRQPKLIFRAGTWCALLGQSIDDGIVGLGNTIEMALRAFDLQYLNALRPPSEAIAFAAAT